MNLHVNPSSYVRVFFPLIYSEGITLCVHSLMSMQACNLSVLIYLCADVNARVVRWSDWFGAESTGTLLSGADGKRCFCAGSGGVKRRPLSRPFFSLTPSLSLSQLLFPSVSLRPSLSHSLSAFSYSIELARTIELGSVSGIEWLELMANYLPLRSLECVCMCVFGWGRLK